MFNNVNHHEKIILTNKEIEKDIATAIKNPPDESKKSYNRFPVLSNVIAVAIVVCGFFIRYISYILF